MFPMPSGNSPGAIDFYVNYSIALSLWFGVNIFPKLSSRLQMHNVDPHRVNADPDADPAFFLIADPDPDPNADPDPFPDPGFSL
jgi:hypothetical protein